MKKKKGFTLIEILIVIGVLGIIALIGTNMFFTILRGSTKTRVLAEVKQNGNYALGVMERLIRNAKSVSGSGSSITVLDLNNKPTSFSCGDSDENGITDIASNSASLISDKVKVDNCSAVFGVTPGEAGIKPAVVTINFTLSQAGTAARPEEQASVNFKTTVTLRNY